MRIARLLVFGFSVAVLCVSCSTEPTPRLVMLNVFCTLGTEHLGPYQDQVDFTPSLDRLAQRGVVFERHVTEAGQSGVAFASIITGEHAMGHRVYSHPTRLTDAVQTLPQAFASAGWDTYFWEAQSMASIPLNYGQGVDPDHAFRKRQLTASDSKFKQILRRLKKDPTYKALIVSFYSLTHTKYHKGSLREFCKLYPGQCEGIDPQNATPVYEDPRAFSYNFPETVERWGLEGEELNDFVEAVELIYKSRVFETDKRFGQIVEAIDEAGLRDETLIAFTADHGETLYRDNSLFKWSHSFDLAPDVVHVPLIVSWRGIDHGRYTEVSSSADVFPTIAALAGVPISLGAASFGEDLSLSLAEGGMDGQRVVFSHTGLWPPRRRNKWWIKQPLLLRYHPRYSPEDVWVSARSGDLVVKYVRGPDGSFRYEAYDLASDPEERSDILDPDEPGQQRLLAELRSYRRALIGGHVDPRSHQDSKSDVDEDKLVEQLRALGYID